MQSSPINTDMNAIPNDVIDQLTLSLLHNSGVATLPLPDHLTQIHQQAFQVATQALDQSSSYVNDDIDNPAPLCPIILPNSNSATVTGYHSAGGDNALSRYNLHRQGFVFSNGESFPFIRNNNDFFNNDNTNGNKYDNKYDLEESFQPCMDQMFDSICNVIASSVLKGIARHLDIDEDWFHHQYGPMDKSSQWHLKRYVLPNSNDHYNANDNACNDNDNDNDYDNDNDNDTGASSSLEEQEVEWLPVHTDPSLISIVIHDAPGTNDNAMGLEYQVSQSQSNANTNKSANSNANASTDDNKCSKNKNEKEERVWKEVEAHGHAVATIFCGSLMSYITGGMFQSAKHRVMYRPHSANAATAAASTQYRQAATLFLRPRGNSILTVPPSDMFLDRVVKIRRNCKFQDWLDRVSRNYQGGPAAPGNDANGKKSKQNGNKTKTKNANTNINADYTHGNATLRSSGHTLRHSKGRTKGKDQGPNTGGNSLPDVIRSKHIIAYDISSYDLRSEVIRMLNELDPETIGEFKREGVKPLRLEYFVVPKDSLLPKKRTRDKNGKGEIAQISLSDHVLHDVQFHQVFDAFVCEVILPEFKERLLACGAIPKENPVKFYYQRPPTLRIQPGPSARAVLAHSDATYGHQDGELNFWMPLTDPTMTKTDLFCESSPGKEDYEPLGAQLGEAVAFHGSSCKHFAPPNCSNNTRVSLDFRVGVEPFFDPKWKMFGTKSDHTRKQVVL